MGVWHLLPLWDSLALAPTVALGFWHLMPHGTHWLFALAGLKGVWHLLLCKTHWLLLCSSGFGSYCALDSLALLRYACSVDLWLLRCSGALAFQLWRSGSLVVALAALDPMGVFSDLCSSASQQRFSVLPSFDLAVSRQLALWGGSGFNGSGALLR